MRRNIPSDANNKEAGRGGLFGQNTPVEEGLRFVVGGAREHKTSLFRHACGLFRGNIIACRRGDVSDTFVT